MDLGEIKMASKSADESFRFENKELDFKMVDFWRWNQSDLLENRNRGILAEFLVRQALGVTSPTRLEWDEIDLKTEDGTKIEIKSAAYLQSWKQKNFSTISFDIAPKCKLLSGNIYSEEKSRAADIYVFCLLYHKNQATINPMDLDQWKFFVLPTKILNDKLPNQKTLRLNTLKALGCVSCSYGQLRVVIERTKQVCL